MAAVMIAMPGCGGEDFLGLEDYQRDVLGGLLAGAAISQTSAGDDAGAALDGRDAADGLNCWDSNGNGAPDLEEDVNGDGTWDALDCQGADGAAGEDGSGTGGRDGIDGLRCWDTNGNDVADADEDTNGDGLWNTLDCAGADGADGSSGSSGASGSAGPDGADGPEFFSVFIDDFFTNVGGAEGSLSVVLASIDEPTLGQVGATVAGVVASDAIAFRVPVPASYRAGNDVTLRLYLYRLNPPTDKCFVIQVDARRARDGGGIELYGETRFLRIVPGLDNVSGLLGDILIAVDLPINTAAGLDFANDLAGGNMLAFELATFVADGAMYDLLGVELNESAAGTATMSAASLVDGGAPCGEDG